MPTVLVKNASLRTFFEETVSAFYELCPDTAHLFEECVRDESATLVKSTGLSADGTLLNYCKIPGVLWAFIKWQGKKRFNDNDLFRDHANYELLCKVWKAALIKRKPSLQVKLSTKET